MLSEGQDITSRMSNLLSDHEVHKGVCEKVCQQWKVRCQETGGG